MSDISEIKSDKSVSYSQFAMWTECPFRWYLNYVKHVRVKSENISSLFGTSMHEVLQEYLQTMYTKTIIEADNLDLSKMLMDRMVANFQLASNNGSQMNIDHKSMMDFYEDGISIIDWFVKNKTDYFPKRGFELIGIEVPLDVPVQKGIKFVAYLDVVIRDTILNRYRIVDIKTSMNGWNKYQKKDAKKLAQLVLYKIFYAKQFDVTPKDIDVEFIIVKRKLWENMDFPQKRIQRLSPADGAIKQNEVMRDFTIFVNTVYDQSGQYKNDVLYPKYPSVKACKYCEYAGSPDICSRNKRSKKLVETIL